MKSSSSSVAGARSEPTLRITEIFLSLQGETSTVGRPTVFVRLTGCPLRCQYCDTAYAFSGGRPMSIADVLAEVRTHHVHFVTVTGGEPLAQPACIELLARLCDAGLRVSLETSGALDVSSVDPRVIKILDVKTPGSGEEARNRFDNFARLTTQDEVKFVVCDRRDYEWARDVCSEHRLPERVAEVLFSPSHTELPPERLADWILADRLRVRLQIQLHKVLWGEEPGR